MQTQSEKLESQPVTRHFIEDLALDPIAETVSTPSGGFRMPSRDAIRAHDARLSAFGGTASVHDDESDDDDESEESTLYAATVDKRRDSMREHSFRLPSQSSRRECLAEMKALGMAWSE